MTPLRHRDFRRLWLAGLISDSGDWLLLVSLPILVFELTGSTLQTSVAFLVELAPAVLLGPFAGYLADRLDRRRLLVTVTVVQAVALLPLLAVHDRGDLPILYAVVAKVPMRSACAMISDLSMPISGRNTSIGVAPAITVMFSSVCDATWPRLSPVTRARAPSRPPSAAAMRSIMRR